MTDTTNHTHYETIVPVTKEDMKELIIERIVFEIDDEKQTSRVVFYSGKRKFMLEYIDTQIDDSPYARQLNVVELED